jgi:hippurate hydrolase
MPVINRVAAIKDEIATWRQDIHRHPELGYEENRTSEIVAEKLKSFGCDEVVSGIAKTGVIGVIRGRRNSSGKVIGLRADMDALPIVEETGLAYASVNKGVMHACGHDGHTAMLLGAAKYLAETRNFDGTAVVIFQPAEEGGGGGKMMVEQGILDRWNIQEVFGMHNHPGMPVGAFALRPGPLLAASDRVRILVRGRGGHASRPHETTDVMLASAHIIIALQSVVARNIDPLEAGVLSLCTIHAGIADNVLPEAVEIKGTARSLTAQVRDLIERRFLEVTKATAAVYGCEAEATYIRGYPVTTNHERQTAFAAGVASEVAGKGNVNTDVAPLMGAEDFSYMLEARPGAFIFVGNGVGAGLHTPRYNFNDDAIPAGVSYWARIVETGMPA